MNDEQYLDYCRKLLHGFAGDFLRRTANLEPEDPLRELATAFSELDDGARDLYTEGPALVGRLFVTHPDFAPTLPRDLLWFLGGECLHFMPDEEIRLYQELEELRREAADQGATLDLLQARAKLLKLQ